MKRISVNWREHIAEGRPYFETVEPSKPAQPNRLRERWAIEELGQRALAEKVSGNRDVAAELYGQCAARWEALGGYDDLASAARHEARACRGAAP